MWLFIYKFSKFCVPIQHPRNGSFWEVFGPLLSQIWSNIAEILTTANKNTENFLKDSSIYGKDTDPKLALLVELWLLFSSWRWPKLKKNKQQCGKTSAIELSKYVKMKSLSPLPFLGKIPSLFAIFGIFLSGNRAGSQVKGVELKFDNYYFIHKIPGQLPVKIFWFKYFTVLPLYIIKDISEKF